MNSHSQDDYPVLTPILNPKYSEDHEMGLHVTKQFYTNIEIPFEDLGLNK